MKAILIGLCTLLTAIICTATELQPSLESPTYVIKQPVIGSMLEYNAEGHQLTSN